MAEQNDGNGRVTLGILADKVDRQTGEIKELRLQIAPFVEMCLTHKAMAEQHIAELYTPDHRSRIHHVEMELQGMVEKNHSFREDVMREFKKAAAAAERGISHRWAIALVVTASILSLGGNLLLKLLFR